MNSVELMLALAAITGLGDATIKNNAAILVTSARLSEVDHGWIEAYYPKAMFFHHKVDVPDGGQRSPLGYLSLVGSTDNRKRITMPFDTSSNVPNYYLKTQDLLKLLSPVEVPDSYFVMNREGLFQAEVTISPATHMKDKSVRLLAMPGVQKVIVPPAADPAQQQQQQNVNPEPPKVETTFPPGNVAYQIEFAAEDILLEKVNKLKTGVLEDGDRSQGSTIYNEILDQVPITFEIFGTFVKPVVKEEEGMPGSTTEPASESRIVKGWRVGGPKYQNGGSLFVPSFQLGNLAPPPPSGSNKDPMTPPVQVTNNDQEIALKGVFRNNKVIERVALNADPVIQKIIKKKIGFLNGEKSLGCKVNESRPTSTACKLFVERDKDDSSKEVGRRYELEFHLRGTIEEQKERNLFYVWDPKEQSDYFEVTAYITPEKEVNAVKKAGISAVRIRPKGSAAENLN